MAKLLNRFGRRICALESLHIEHPVGRSGARFQAVLLGSVLEGLDVRRLRFYVLEDDAGQRYAATIDQVVPRAENAELSAICGVVVAG